MFLEDFRQVGLFGKTSGGGVDRQAGSRSDGEARAWFRRTLRERGARVSVDRIGNVIGFFDWLPEAPYVLCGSHLDSQPTGGRFDGAYGVVAALSAAEEASERMRRGEFVPARNLAVVDWTNEEGARFEPSMMGSSVFSGALELEVALRSSDESGTTVAQALEDIGFLGSDEIGEEFAGYVEIHVEQGRELTENCTQIGLVEGNWAAYKYDVLLMGEQSHTGATRMVDRRDALWAVSQVIDGVRLIAEIGGGDLLHTSVTKLQTYPHSPNVVTSKASCHVELRSPDPEVLTGAEQEFETLLAFVQEKTGVTVVVRQEWHREPARYWPTGLDLAERCAGRAGLSHRRMRTISGHDSIPLNKVVPTIMLFVPSVGGWAHSERELTSDSDMLNGVTMLTEVLTELCRPRTLGEDLTYRP